MAYPLNRPIAAVCEAPQVDATSGRRGRLLFMGLAYSLEKEREGDLENSR
jgi:hypothetical protein